MSAEPCRLLYVDDEPSYCRLFSRSMEDDERFQVMTATSGREAVELLREFPADVVLTDLLMPQMDGLELLDEIRRTHPDIFVLILTGVDSADKAVKAMRAGAYDYILKPLDMALLLKQLEKIIHHKQVLQASLDGDGASFCLSSMVGRDKTMLELFDKVQQVARTDATVLISGESGTGKELIAEAIHLGSRRKAKPFVRVNCAALTDSLINAALFGHEKGAFTGATERKAGFFESASGGTIFLDEIGDIPIQTQVALLRILELGCFQRVGGTETIKVDTRVICATNKDLTLAMENKEFREDLYYRINVVSLTVPPLRARKPDIPLLVSFFLERSCEKTGKQIAGVSDAAMAILCQYPWPGNVRQLANVVERMVVFCRKRHILPEHLPAEVLPGAENDFMLTLHDSSLAAAEELLVRTVLEEKSWHLTQAAQALGISRGTLYSKMVRYGIAKPY
ncbi:sigma-54-dependent transcriptional regulator [Trichlorobacter ammonificans]|uniref:Transcriptional regulatory protein ZraR n=1 Tax=Trichlorobacter ammonificans TaxID=2916410 RepID=A0ABM9D4K3_9BACT|nr:sigma-54 dependent transcriptional regulator [Trichlorobacter ammonificans]CAH2030193.1 Transcriptional regulatory protein ZraR [Trichlorobacter ammonificans]